MKKRLNTSASIFSKIIENNGMYVDKTAFLYELLQQNPGQYFLSRPRRFGKTLTLSTLKSIFEGEKELFKGLYIYDKPYDWKKYPIIRLAFNSMSSSTLEAINEKVIFSLERIADDENIILKPKNSVSKFNELIYQLYKKHNSQVVVLIDEYDKPILDNILQNLEVEKIRGFLKKFYGTIKAQEEYIRFAFLTGVSKFTHVSVFSDLNNLTDLTMIPKFAEICGFTQQEVEHYFKEWIEDNHKQLGMTKEEYLLKLKRTYDGIRFSEKPTTLYNPVSLTKSMEYCSFDHYWFETGTPTFLLKLLKEKDYNIIQFEKLETRPEVFSTYEIDKLRVEPLLFQTGYLTIKDYDEKDDVYILSYPNMEVKSSFLSYLSEYFTPVDQINFAPFLIKLRKGFENNDFETIFEILNSFYAKIENSIKIKQEKYYQTIFYLLFMFLGFRIKVEQNTNKGRMDAVVETENYVYIFEFKLNKTALEALKQIKEKEYFQRYKDTKKELYLIGVSFNTNTGEIKEKEIEKI